MKVISHSDADGKLSAYLVARKFNIVDEEDIIITNYGKDNDISSKVSKDEKVVICDFSIQVAEMKKLMEITNNIIWIDHHISAINKYDEFRKDIAGLRVNGTAACMLTYIYFYVKDLDGELLELTQSECEELYNKAPLLVRLIHDNDVWRFDYKETQHFKLGLMAENLVSALDPRWESLFASEDEVNKLVVAGSYIEKYRDSLGSMATNKCGFECTINGKKGFAMNNAFGGSQWFSEEIRENYDFVCIFTYINSQDWIYSFYSTKENINCAEIAQYINPDGGGHKGAAGCVTDKLIFGGNNII